MAQEGGKRADDPTSLGRNHVEMSQLRERVGETPADVRDCPRARTVIRLRRPSGLRRYHNEGVVVEEKAGRGSMGLPNSSGHTGLEAIAEEAQRK